VQEDVANVTPPSVAVLQAPAPKEAAKAVAEEAKPQPPGAEATPERRAAPKAAAPLARSRSQSDIPSPAAPAAPPETRALESQAILRGPAAAPEVPQAFGQRADQAARDSAGEASRERAEVASGVLAKRAKVLDETPEKALERIAELRRAGKHDEADRALAGFRKRFPDYKLSDEMKAKVERR
jgi:hypothetical protein